MEQNKKSDLNQSFKRKALIISNINNTFTDFILHV